MADHDRDTREQLTGEAQPTERPVIRLFGPLAIEQGARTPRTARSRRRAAEAGARDTARGPRPRVPVDRLAELIWGDEPPAEHRRLAPDVHLDAAAAPHARPRARPRRSSSPSPRPIASPPTSSTLDLDRFDELLERSAREPTRLARALARAGARPRSRRGARGRAVRDLGARPARQLPGPHPRRPPRRGGRRARRARLSPRARPRRGGGGARPLQRARAPPQMLALYALGRAHEALGRYRSFRLRLDEELGLEPGAETRAVESAIIRQEEVRSLAAAPDPACAGRGRRPRCTPARPHRRARDTRRRPSRPRSTARRADPDRGRGRARQDAPARRAGATSSTASASAARAAPSSSSTCRTCRSRPRFGTRSPASSSTRDGCLRSRRSCPSSRSTRRGREFDELEVLEALVALVAEHGPIALLLDDLHWADPDARRARLPAPTRGRARASRS